MIYKYSGCVNISGQSMVTLLTFVIIYYKQIAATSVAAILLSLFDYNEIIGAVPLPG